MAEQLFNTHKFFFTLNHEGTIKGKKVKFLDRSNKLQTAVVERIEIGTSPISFRLFEKDGTRHTILFIKIREVFDQNDELVWDSTEVDLSNVRTIKYN